MDHAANDVLQPITITANSPRLYRFLELVCQAKGRTTVGAIAPEPLNRHPVIVDHNLPISGLHHILAYLDDKYPDPPLCFDTPDRRVIVRMAVEQIVDDLYDVGPPPEQHPTLLALAHSLANKRFVMDRLSLLDLALLPVSPPGPVWDRHRQAVLKAIE